MDAYAEDYEDDFIEDEDREEVEQDQEQVQQQEQEREDTMGPPRRVPSQIREDQIKTEKEKKLHEAMLICQKFAQKSGGGSLTYSYDRKTIERHGERGKGEGKREEEEANYEREGLASGKLSNTSPKWRPRMDSCNMEEGFSSVGEERRTQQVKEEDEDDDDEEEEGDEDEEEDEEEEEEEENYFNENQENFYLPNLNQINQTNQMNQISPNNSVKKSEGKSAQSQSQRQSQSQQSKQSNFSRGIGNIRDYSNSNLNNRNMVEKGRGDKKRRGQQKGFSTYQTPSEQLRHRERREAEEDEEEEEDHYQYAQNSSEQRWYGNQIEENEEEQEEEQAEVADYEDDDELAQALALQMRLKGHLHSQQSGPRVGSRRGDNNSHAMSKKNFTFKETQLQSMERENRRLLSSMMSIHRRGTSEIPTAAVTKSSSFSFNTQYMNMKKQKSLRSSHGINRNKRDQEIYRQNLALAKRLETVKSNLPQNKNKNKGIHMHVQGSSIGGPGDSHHQQRLNTSTSNRIKSTVRLGRPSEFKAPRKPKFSQPEWVD